ncbi:MAG TPA: hypothetical protein VGB37_09310 [Candidatus Lokiarchaeia archaeon]
MEKLILLTTEYKMLISAISKDKSRIELSGIFILKGYIYASNGYVLAKIEKDVQRSYPIDGAYAIKGAIKFVKIGFELILEKIEQDMPNFLEQISDGFTIEVFEMILDKTTFKSTLPLIIYDFLKKSINVDLLDVLYDVCRNEKIQIYITNNDKVGTPIMIFLPRLNIQYVVAPYNLILPENMI